MSSVDAVINEIRPLAAKVAEMNNIELIDVEITGSPNRSFLKVTIDKEGGVSLMDCEQFSRELEALLDVEDPIPGRYTLEVTSPGLDRPLRTIGDFAKRVGKKVRIVTKEPIDGQSFFVGRVSGVDDSAVLLDLGKTTVRVEYANIKRAKLEIEF